MATMDVAAPYKAVCAALDGEVLHPRRQEHGPDRPSGCAVDRQELAQWRVCSVLDRLTGRGSSTACELNRAYLYALNREHLAAPAVEILDGMREQLLSEIRAVLDTWQIAPLHIIALRLGARAETVTRTATSTCS